MKKQLAFSNPWCTVGIHFAPRANAAAAQAQPLGDHKSRENPAAHHCITLTQRAECDQNSQLGLRLRLGFSCERFSCTHAGIFMTRAKHWYPEQLHFYIITCILKTDLAAAKNA